MLIRALSLLAIVLSSLAHADSFDVQIGAFRNPDAAKIALPDGVGELRSTTGADGLTRFLVGPFAERAAADRARDRLRAAGFGGAFVRATPDDAAPRRTSASTRTSGAAPPAGTPRKDPRVEASSVPQRDLDLLMSLSAEQRRDLVYLDGRLHRKVGDQFIPLRD